MPARRYGGAKYRISSHQRFSEHTRLRAGCERGLAACKSSLAGEGRQAVRGRSARRALGLKVNSGHDRAFAESYARQNSRLFSYNSSIVAAISADLLRPRHGARRRSRWICSSSTIPALGHSRQDARAPRRYALSRRMRLKSGYWDMLSRSGAKTIRPNRVMEFLARPTHDGHEIDPLRDHLRVIKFDQLVWSARSGRGTRRLCAAPRRAARRMVFDGGRDPKNAAHRVATPASTPRPAGGQHVK